MQSPADRAKLAEPELFLADHAGELVILDEIHHAPGLFPVLRGVIDRQRRAKRAAGHILLLGSASPSLLRQSGETLAGRIAYLELTPLTLNEIGTTPPDDLWLRGGFPNSLLQPTPAAACAGAKISPAPTWNATCRTSACDDVQPARRFVVYPGTQRFRLSAGVDVLPLDELLALVVSAWLLQVPHKQRRFQVSHR